MPQFIIDYMPTHAEDLPEAYFVVRVEQHGDKHAPDPFILRIPETVFAIMLVGFEKHFSEIASPVPHLLNQLANETERVQESI